MTRCVIHGDAVCYVLQIGEKEFPACGIDRLDRFWAFRNDLLPELFVDIVCIDTYHSSVWGIPAGMDGQFIAIAVNYPEEIIELADERSEDHLIVAQITNKQCIGVIWI